MGIFETHAHYTDSAFDSDRDELLSSMNDAGIETIVEIGDNINHSKLAIELAAKYDFMYTAVGIHPECVDDLNENDFIELENMLDEKEKNKIVAVGEIGLDYYYTKDNKEKQIEIFKKQLDIALRYNLPVVIHSREATQDTYDILSEYCQKGLRGIVHCFSDSLEFAKLYEKLGMYIGIGGVLTFKNGRRLQEIVSELDIKNFVLETDSPYLSPEPNRGQRNDSRNLVYVARRISELKNISYDDVVKITKENAHAVYNL